MCEFPRLLSFQLSTEKGGCRGRTFPCLHFGLDSNQRPPEWSPFRVPSSLVLHLRATEARERTFTAVWFLHHLDHGRRVASPPTAGTVRQGDFIMKETPGRGVELVVGIEPTTCGLQSRCSTVEPYQHDGRPTLFSRRYASVIMRAGLVMLQ